MYHWAKELITESSIDRGDPDSQAALLLLIKRLADIPDDARIDPLRDVTPWDITSEIIRGAGLDPEHWGYCTLCDGTGVDPAVRDNYDAWLPTEPPEGPGYQLWDRCIEAPLSPIFDTLQALCKWASRYATVYAEVKTTVEGWERLLK